MANMTFKASLLPNTDLGYSLGSEDKQWNIYGELNGNASSANKLSHTPNNTTTFLRGDNTFSNKLTGNIYTKGYYMDQANPDSTETHKANIHLWGDVVAFTYRNSDNTYLGDAFYYNINNGNITAKHEVYITNGNLSVGTAEETTNQRRITLNSGSGDLILFSNASATGSRGLWVSAHGTGAGKNIITIDTNNNATFNGSAATLKDRTNNTLTYSNYGAAGLAASAVTWLTCWNGYELRAISKAEMANAVNSARKWVLLTGDTMSGTLYSTGFWANQGSGERQVGVTYSNGNLYFWANPSSGTAGIYDSNGGYVIQRDTSTNKYNIYGQRVYGAVWNDYAEFRKDNPKEKQEPGRCVREIGDGTLSLTTKRLERGCEIISDTFGFAIGQDKENGYNTPIASNGRVLAYPYESIEEFSKHIGWPVCSGPDGTVSIMTEEEEEKYPSRIIGTISEIPIYKEWGTGKIKVNGRIWIRIR